MSDTPAPIFQWSAATTGIRIDAYHDSLHGVTCDAERRCIDRAIYQVRHVDIYDGDWRQTCREHLDLALIQVIEAARMHQAGFARQGERNE